MLRCEAFTAKNQATDCEALKNEWRIFSVQKLTITKVLHIH